MEEENVVTPDSTPVTDVGEDTPTVSEDVKTPTPSEPIKTEEKVVPYTRFKEVVDELNQVKKQPPQVKTALGVEDYIGISAALEGLDQREKEKLAYEHKLTGKPLKEIRESEDYNLWQSAYQVKREKERASLAPSSTQPEADRPKGLKEKLASASLEEKEKILAEAGLWKSPRPKADRTNIGVPRGI